MRQYKNYTDEDIIKYAKEVKSIAQLLKKLNLKQAGGNYSNIKSQGKRLGGISCRVKKVFRILF